MQKTALITGASRGIGAECARALSRDGYRVIINYNESKEPAERLAEELGGTAFRTDVSDAEAVRHMFRETGETDVLVLNAGISHYGLFTDTTDEQWRRVFDVNVGGVINCCREAIPRMVRQRSGRIITVSSVWGVTGASCESVYAASKAAVIGLTKSLALELRPSGVNVNCVAPGVIMTEMLTPLTPDELSELAGRTPLGRLGLPSDVAAAVRFLASDAAQSITGQVLGVDGGFMCAP